MYILWDYCILTLSGRQQGYYSFWKTPREVLSESADSSYRGARSTPVTSCASPILSSSSSSSSGSSAMPALDTQTPSNRPHAYSRIVTRIEEEKPAMGAVEKHLSGVSVGFSCGNICASRRPSERYEGLGAKQWVPAMITLGSVKKKNISGIHKELFVGLLVPAYKSVGKKTTRRCSEHSSASSLLYVPLAPGKSFMANTYRLDSIAVFAAVSGRQLSRSARVWRRACFLF